MKKSLALSAFIHLCLLSLLAMPFFLHHQKIGNMKNIQIHYTTPFLFKEANVQHQTELKGSSRLLHSSPITPQKQINGKESKLLFFLHDQIQQALSGLNINSESRDATLAFSLLPSGRITNVYLVHATQNFLLDKKIISLVEKIDNIPAPLLPRTALDFRIEVKLSADAD